MQMDEAGRQGTIRTAKFIIMDEAVLGLYRGVRFRRHCTTSTDNTSYLQDS
jgi:hypothetical protein